MKPEPIAGDDRRVWPRVRLSAEAILRFDGIDAQMRSRILNASLNGLLLAAPAPRPVGTRMRITVFVRNPPVQFRIEGVVVHCREHNCLYDDDMPSTLGIYLTHADKPWETLCQACGERPRPRRVLGGDGSGT